MKYILLLALVFTTMINELMAQNKPLDFSKVKYYEHQLDDVMEIIDTTELKNKLDEVELIYKKEPSEINKVRLGIIYHETSLNLGFVPNSNFKGYAKKSYDLLTALELDSKTTKELMPFITSYRASALSLLGGETRKLGLIGDAFKLFKESVARYGNVSYSPEFLRGSVSENLPRIFFLKRRFAKTDMQSIIDKQNENSEYANPKIMSFVYWSWANKRQGKKHRAQSMEYLDKAISLDPNYQAGRKKAEELKNKIRKKYR